MEAKQLIDVVEAVFPLGPLPEMSLHQAQLADQSMSREISKIEWDAAGKVDAGRSWRDFGDEELMACDVALAHLEERSFVYYLPAFLLFAVRHCRASWPEPTEALVGTVVFSVTQRSPYDLGRYKRLTAERAAVIAFLEFMAENGNHHERPLAEKRSSVTGRPMKHPSRSSSFPNKPLVPTRNGEAPLLAAQRRR